MDPFTLRLRKQRERSTLKARQLNKNASSMLQRQLRILHRRRSFDARIIRRTKDALRRELCELQKVETGEDPASTVMENTRSGGRCRSTPRVPDFDYTKPKPHVKVQDANLESLTLEVLPSLASSEKNCVPLSSVTQVRESSLVSPSRSDNETHRKSKHALPTHACRYSSSSQLPCPHFPCMRPLTYNRLKISDVPDPPILAQQEGYSLSRSLQLLQLTPILAGAGGSPVADSSIAENTTLHKPSFENESLGFKAVSGASLLPPSSIQKRLRRLRHFAWQMRLQNEAEKPRDWAVNYGESVSRRMLTKPVKLYGLE